MITKHVVAEFSNFNVESPGTFGKNTGIAYDYSVGTVSYVVFCHKMTSAIGSMALEEVFTHDILLVVLYLLYCFKAAV